MSAPTTSKKKPLEKNVTVKTIELSEIFWNKTNFEHLNQSFDITRADIRKILS